MSTEIDEKVVEMRFDNSDFEKNAAASMGTLAKLKESLNFDGFEKGFNELSKSASNVDMSTLGKGVDTVGQKFSAMSVIAVTALAKITNSAIDSGTRLVKSLSVDNIAAGWQKFTDKTQSVSTLLAQGYDIDTVTDQLDRLNWFTDETSYNFTDMVSNIAKFTASGQDLETSVTAIEGIANWAALSGQNAATASRAMYQLSQAMGSGLMRKEDYKSIQNASMDTDEFRQKAIDAAIAIGTLKDNLDGTYTSLVNDKGAFTKNQFADHLTQDAWFTSDVMMQVYNDYSNAVSKIYDYAEEHGVTASEAIEALGDEVDAFGLKAFKAAQEARSWSDVIDSVKDAVSTGWMNTFEIIFGNAKEATELWTGLANALWDIFAGGAEGRNEFFTEVLRDPISGLVGKISKIAKPASTAVEAIENVTKTMDEAGLIAEVIAGKWGIGEERMNALTQAGYNYYRIQNGVNEALGDSYRFSDEIVNANDTHVESLSTLSEAAAETDETIGEYIERLSELSDEDLAKDFGLDQIQVKSIRDIANEADHLGVSIQDLVDNAEDINGRWLIIDAFSNLWEVISSVREIAMDAWAEVFPSENLANILAEIIAAFHRFSSTLKVDEATAIKLKLTFKGLFAILDMLKIVIMRPIKAAFEAFGKVLGLCNVNILDYTSKIGMALIRARNWLNTQIDLESIISVLSPAIQTVIDAISGWIDAAADWVTSNVDVQVAINTIVSVFTDAVNAIASFISGLAAAEDKSQFFADLIANAFSSISSVFAGGSESIGADFVNGIGNGILSAAQFVYDAIVSFAQTVIATIRGKEGFDEHSPSVVGFAIGAFFILGILAGMAATSGDVGQWIKDSFIPNIKEKFETLKSYINVAINWLKTNVVPKIKNYLDEKGLSEITGTLFGGGLIASILNFSKAIKNVSKDTKGFGTIATSISEAITNIVPSVTDLIKSPAAALKTMSEGVKDMFGGLSVMFKDVGEMFLGGKKALVGIGKYFKRKGLKEMAAGLKDVAIAIAILSASVIALGYASTKYDLWESAKMIGVFAGSLVAIAFALSKIPVKDGIKMSSYAVVLVGLGAAFALMGKAMLSLSQIPDDSIGKVHQLMTVITILIVGLMAATRLISSNLKGSGGAFLAIAATLYILIKIGQMIGDMSFSEFTRAAFGFMVLGGMLVALFAATNLINENVKSSAGAFISLAIVMLVMTRVLKILGGMDISAILKGALGMALLEVLIYGFILLTKSLEVSGDASGVIKSIKSLGIALLLMSASVAILGNLDADTLKKGLIAVGVLELLIILMIGALSGQKEKLTKVGGTLYAFAIAIGILAVVVTAMGLVPTSILKKGLGVVTIIGGLVVAFTYALKGAANATKSLIAFALIVGALAALVFVFLQIPMEDLGPRVACIAVLLSAMAILMAVASGYNGKFGQVLGVLVLMGVALAEIGAILWAMEKFDVNPSIETAGSIGVLLVAMAATTLILSKVGEGAAAAVKGAAAMMAVIAIIAAVSAGLGALASLIPEGDKEKILNGISFIGDIFVELAGIIGEAIGALVGGIFEELGDSLTSFTLKSMPFFSWIRTLDEQTLAGVGILASTFLMLAEADLVGLIGGLVEIITFGKGDLESIGTQLGSFAMNSMPFFLLASVLGASTASAAEGVSAIESAVNMVSNIGLFSATKADALASIGEALSEFAPKGKAFLDAFDGVTASSIYGVWAIAYAISAISDATPKTGGIFEWFTGTTDYDAIGTALTKLAVSMVTFSATMALLDTSGYYTGIFALGALGKAFDYLPTTKGLPAFFDGTTDIDTLSTGLTKLAGAMHVFGMMCSTMDYDGFSTGCTALTDFGVVLDDFPVNKGVPAFFKGSTDLDNLSSGLSKLGPAMAGFAECFKEGSFSQNDLDTGLTALQSIGTTFETMPEIGGFASIFGADNDPETWGKQLQVFGTGVGQGFAWLQDFDTEQFAAFTAQIAPLCTALEGLPEVGGFASIFTADNDPKTVGRQLKVFGNGIASFADSTADIDTEHFSGVVEAVGSLGTALELLPEVGGFLSIFTADNDPSSFANQLPALGDALADFSTSVEDLDAAQLTSIAGSLSALADFSNSLGDSDDFGNVKGFRKWLTDMASDGTSGFIAEFNNNMPAAEAAAEQFINSAIKGAKVRSEELTNVLSEAASNAAKNASIDTSESTLAATEMTSSMVSGIQSASREAAKAASDVASNAVLAIRSQNSAMNSAGMMLMTYLAKGIKAYANSVISAMTSPVSNGSYAIRNQYNSYYNAGSYLAQGLIKGIQSQTNNVYNAAYKLGETAVKAEMEGQQSHSPSRAMIKAGNYLGMGLVIGMKDMFGQVTKTGNSMGETVTSAISDAISIASEMTEDISATPTIRPILNLDDIRNGVGEMNGLLSASQVGVRANISAISSNMNRGQNESEVVSAIQSLEKKLRPSGDTYIVDGVTYDDGSNIRDAVSTIVRAARIERRK